MQPAYHDEMSEYISPANAHADPGLSREPIRLLADAGPGLEMDPAAIVLTCANCGALMDERKCKLICRCGYFASCSDYY
jgi:hypothetical protein